MDKAPICCVDIVFLNKEKDKTLLFRRNNEPVKNVYYTIGGRLLKGEDFLDCAIRQGKKELNLKINPKKLFLGGIIQDHHKNSVFKKISYDVVDIFYGYILGDKDLKNMRFDSQHSDHKWFSVKNPSLHHYIKERLRQTFLRMKER